MKKDKNMAEFEAAVRHLTPGLVLAMVGHHPGIWGVTTVYTLDPAKPVWEVAIFCSSTWDSEADDYLSDFATDVVPGLLEADLVKEVPMETNPGRKLILTKAGRAHVEEHNLDVQLTLMFAGWFG